VHAGAVCGELFEGDAWMAARMIATCARDERADVTVSLARLGEEHQARGAISVGRYERDLRADDAADAEFTRSGGETHSAAEVVVIGEREGGRAERVGACGECLGG